jgi:hypothetical protein
MVKETSANCNELAGLHRDWIDANIIAPMAVPARSTGAGDYIKARANILAIANEVTE